MKILFIGDVVGGPGRQAIVTLVPQLRQQRALDLVIANGENSAHGAGLTEATVQVLLSAGVDVITTGDHVWDQKGFEKVLAVESRVLRPANLPAGTPGQGTVVVTAGNGVRMAVMNLVGRVFMPAGDCPFRTAQAQVPRLREQTNIIVVDMHAEATSEKMALARLFDGQVSAVIGTHTHVPTADEQILPQGTAFISDVGMTGPHDSILGRESAAVIRRFLTQMPQRLEVAKGNVILNGAIVDLDENSGRSRSIERVRRAC